MVCSASRNRSFRYAARETSRGLKPRARGWPLARYRRIAWPPSTCRDRPTTGVLYGVVRTHLSELLAAVDAQTDGGGLPGFVVGEFRKFLRCGVLSHGFCRVRCGDCAFERLVPFSCKGRAVCPSCGGRRMKHAS